MKKKYCSLHGFEPWSLHSAMYYVFALSSWHWATPAEWITPFKCSLSATERRTTAAKRDDLHSKSLFLVKNKGQWNAKISPKAAYGNFAMRTKFSGRLESKWERTGRNWSNFAHWHTHTTAAKLVVRNSPLHKGNERKNIKNSSPESIIMNAHYPFLKLTIITWITSMTVVYQVFTCTANTTGLRIYWTDGIINYQPGSSIIHHRLITGDPWRQCNPVMNWKNWIL